MGGDDKRLLPLTQGPVLGEVIERFAPNDGPVILSANGDPARFAAFGLTVVPDKHGALQGLLAGIAAGLTWLRAECPELSFAVTEVDPFCNINTPENLDYARTLAARLADLGDGVR